MFFAKGHYFIIKLLWVKLCFKKCIAGGLKKYLIIEIYIWGKKKKYIDR